MDRDTSDKMALPASRIERFLRLIGGEQNLPPKLPQAPPPSAPTAEESNDVSMQASNEPSTTESPTSTEIAEPNSQTAAPQTIPPASNLGQLNVADVDLTWDERLGEPAPLGIDFSPFGAVSKFCYKFVAREFQQPLATAFFDAGKIFARDWDL